MIRCQPRRTLLLSLNSTVILLIFIICSIYFNVIPCLADMSFRRIYSPFAFSARSIIILSAYLPFVDIFIVLHLSSRSLLPVLLLLNYYDITFFDKCQSSEPFVRYPFSPFLILECLQSINCSLNQIFQCPSKHIRSAFDDFSGTSCCEILALVFFLYRL